MAVQVNPITPSLPPATGIQDPAARRFAQAVHDALNALRSEEGAVESLKRAAAAMSGANAGTPPGIAQWLFSSELYQKLTQAIERVDVKAKQDLLAEALARQTAIDEINATLATIQSTAPYDPAATYPVGVMVTYEGKLYQAILETTGNLPTNTTYWKKVGDYATLGDVVSAHTLEISDLESRVASAEGGLTAEIAQRNALAAQVRGSYTGSDINMVSQGLIYSERVARAAADSTEVAARQSLSAKLTGSTDPEGLELDTLTSGLIFEERQARVSADGAIVSTLDAVEARTDAAEGAIIAEQNLRASNDLAIVQAVNTALAQITGVSSSISQSGENLIANWTTAQATKWSQIESEVLTAGGQSIRAALQQEATTRANADGSLGAQWTLKTDINGYIAGFGFASTANNATPTSEFIIRADKFAVVMPGYGEHVPFAIGPSGAEFTGLTNWGNVTGAGRPEDYAATNDANILPDGNFVKQATGQGSYWTLTSGVSITSTQGENSTAGLRLNANGQYQYAVQNNFIPARAGDVFFVRARVFVASGSTGNQSIQMTCHDGNKDELPSYPNAGNVRTSVTNGSWQTFEGKITISHAGTQYVRVRPLLDLSATTGHLIISDLWVSRAIATQITSSNVTTYIANAAIGNAQIDRATVNKLVVGTADIANAAITNAKIGNAAVDTLQVAGNAVSAPQSQSVAASSSETSTTSRTSTFTLGTFTTSHNGRGQVLILLSPNTHVTDSATAACAAYGIGNTSYTAKISIQRNGIDLVSVTDAGSAIASLSKTLHTKAILDTPGANVNCTYRIYIKTTSDGTRTHKHAIPDITVTFFEFKR